MPDETPDGIDAARLVLRQAGYCVMCNRVVERVDGGGCAAGHPAQAISGRIMLEEGEPIPVLPRFNLAAFLIPPIWGPAHGQWAGAIFLPLWLFADSAMRNASMNTATLVMAVLVGTLTVAAMGWFASRANGLAWRRVCDRVDIPTYLRTQRVWAIVSVPVAALLLGAALYFDLVVLASS